MFSYFTDTQMLAFWWTMFIVMEVSETLHDYNFAWGLAIYTRSDVLYLMFRSWVWQNHKLQIVSRFLSTVV